MDFSKETEECRRIYETDFNPTNYVRYFVETPAAEKSELFFNSKTMEAFSSGKAKGPRCVDVGAGPMIHRLAIASRYCDELYASDFLKVNQEAVNKFLSTSPMDPSYKATLRSVSILERFENIDNGVEIIGDRLKSKLRGSVPCDVLQGQPLGDLDSLGGPFDIAISNGCLETACTSLQEFNQALKNLSTLLKPGGSLLLMTYLGEDFYKIGDASFPVVVVQREDVERGLTGAGFLTEELEVSTDVSLDILKHCNTTSFLFALAVKP